MLLQAPEGHFECQVFCAKTIVIVKDCCLVAGGLCRSSASLHQPFGTAFLSGAAHKAAAGHAPAEPPATITSLDNAPQSKLRSSAQGLLRLLCDSDAQNQPGFYVRDKKTAVRDADSGLGSGGRRSRTDDPLLAKQML